MTRNPLTSQEWAELRSIVQQSTSDVSKKRWGQGRINKPAEDAVNRWAAQQLITAEQWQRMENLYPGDLRKIAEVLELPVAAVIWRARSAERRGLGREISLDGPALAMISKPAIGSGGIQSLLRSLQSNLQGDRLSVTPRQFERLREYLVNLGGGGKARLQSVMNCITQALQQAGGLGDFFPPEPETLAGQPAKKTPKRASRGIKAAVPRSMPRAKPEKPRSPQTSTPTTQPSATSQTQPSVIQWRLPVTRRG